MSFDPEKVQRFAPAHAIYIAESRDGGFVRYSDYAQLLALLHDVSSEADPAGTLRELRQAQDTVRALEKQVEELKARLSDG